MEIEGFLEEYTKIMSKKITQQILTILKKDEEWMQWKDIRDAVIKTKKGSKEYGAKLKELGRTLDELLRLEALKRKYINRNAYYGVADTWESAYTISGDLRRILSTPPQKAWWNFRCVTFYDVMTDNEGLDLEEEYRPTLKDFAKEIEEIGDAFGHFHKDFWLGRAKRIKEEIEKYMSGKGKEKKEIMYNCIKALEELFLAPIGQENFDQNVQKIKEFMKQVNTRERQLIESYGTALAETHKNPMIIYNYMSGLYFDATAREKIFGRK